MQKFWRNTENLETIFEPPENFRNFEKVLEKLLNKRQKNFDKIILQNFISSIKLKKNYDTIYKLLKNFQICLLNFAISIKFVKQLSKLH